VEDDVVPEKQIDEFVTRARTGLGDNLQSIVLYGSAATGDFHPDFSNVNLLCVLRDTSYQTLAKLAPTVEWWNHKKHPSPLVLTQKEIEASADVFSIELLDIQQRHRVLFGDDVLASLRIPMHWHRAQLEYEMREKLILLRERLLATSFDKGRLWDLLLHSLPAFTTLFRHTLMNLGEPVPATKREAVEILSRRVTFDAAPFFQLLDIREHKAERSQFDVNDVFARYLTAVEQITAAVDTMLDSTGPRPS
jgi:predicted nucleotidyltransferase